jgi:[ribosomal protein S5]-alanine N-acetyltransferase
MVRFKISLVSCGKYQRQKRKEFGEGLNLFQVLLFWRKEIMDTFFTEVPTLETKHYLLRGITLEDASELFTMLGNKETMKYITPNPVTSVEEVKEIISTYLTRFLEKKEIPWVILEKDTGKVVGQFRLHKVHTWHRKAEMGAVIREGYQGKGIMSEVLQSLLPFVFETLKLNRLVGDIFAENEGSRKLLEKYNFTKEGVLRNTDFDGERFHDTVVYSMLRKEYLEKRSSIIL